VISEYHSTGYDFSKAKPSKNRFVDLTQNLLKTEAQ
jgi:hypothetical protein